MSHPTPLGRTRRRARPFPALALTVALLGAPLLPARAAPAPGAVQQEQPELPQPAALAGSGVGLALEAENGSLSGKVAVGIESDGSRYIQFGASGPLPTPTGPAPTATATSSPTSSPTPSPAATPTSSPAPTQTAAPTSTPTSVPPTVTPTPSATPTEAPTAMPTAMPTATPTATPPPGAPPFQPAAPYYGTFYYGWFKNPAVDGSWGTWNSNGTKPPATWFSHYLPDPNPAAFDPARELYSARDPVTIYWQLQKMAEARIEFAISSWWGPGKVTDDNFRLLIQDVMNRADNPYPNLRWTLYYEEESTGDPTVEKIVADLNYIADNYANQRAFFRIGGKPVIFVYATGGDGAAMVQRWVTARSQAKMPFFVVLKLFSGYKTVTPQPDGWHQYGPGSRLHQHAPYSAAVSPGFWHDGDAAPTLVRDLAAFRSAAQQMVAANTVFKLVTTWNEWGEGTGVEPAEQVRTNTAAAKEEQDPNGAPFRNAYVDTLRELLPPLEAGTGVPLGSTEAAAAQEAAALAAQLPSVESEADMEAAAASGACVSMPSAGGTALVSLTVATPGSYRLWSRMAAATAKANYYWLQVDKNCPVKVQTAAGSAPGSWQWVNFWGGNPANTIDVTLSAGLHTIRVANNSGGTGVRLDKLIATTDATCVPTGAPGSECLSSPGATAFDRPAAPLDPQGEEGGPPPWAAAQHNVFLPTVTKQ